MNTTQQEREQLKENFNRVFGERAKNRKKLIEEITQQLICLLKKEYTSFTREQIALYISSKNKKASKYRLIDSILKSLIQNKVIKKDVITKEYHYFSRNNILSSKDYGSYQKLMEKNGYNRELFNFKFDELNKIPIKKKVKTLKVFEDINTDFDESELTSYKPQEKQGVYTNSSKSYIRLSFHRKHDIFTFI